MSMKKVLSLAAVLAVVGSASPAMAEVKLSGDLSSRIRAEYNNDVVSSTGVDASDDFKWQYRLRLNAAADLGSGYFMKAQVTNEHVAGSWTTVSAGNSELFDLDLSQFYFGRNTEKENYAIGRLPLNSFNNPIYDLALYAVPARIPGAVDANLGGGGSSSSTGGTVVYAVDTPALTYNFDRAYALSYGRKIGEGEAKASLIVRDNYSGSDSSVEGDGLLGDGYVLNLAYKANIGNVTVEPQALIAITDNNSLAYNNVSSNTFGANITIPVSKSKIGVSGFYTIAEDSKGKLRNANTGADAGDADVDFNGYLVRIKGETGPFMAWVDYNHTDDKTNSLDNDYNNLFVWAQYKQIIHESAAGTVSLTPVIRYRASTSKDNVADTDSSSEQLRTELWATVTF